MEETCVIDRVVKQERAVIAGGVRIYSSRGSVLDCQGEAYFIAAGPLLRYSDVMRYRACTLKVLCRKL